MTTWAFEVRHGCLDRLPAGIVETVAEEQQSASFFVAEAGNLLNEPDDRIVYSISKSASGAESIAAFARACSWLFELLEVEFDQYYRSNYIRLAFVNLQVAPGYDGTQSGKMTTNCPELPSPTEQPPGLVMHQFITTFRVFFRHLRGCTEVSPTDADLQFSDWVTITFNRAP